MQHYYDGQLRRYLTQIIRLLSNFVVRYGDGTLVRVPVMYGDPDRQAASIVAQNSENTVQSCPRIAVYITDFDLDRTRLSDSSYVSKLHLRERAVETDDQGNDFYTSEQGRKFTVERLMPTPFSLTVKVDIWSSNTDQKLQILEQILVLFNPSLEIQTTDNFIDWTSLTVVELEDVNFSGRTVPVGTNSSIDIATITLKTPAWLSPPAKVKKLGVITRIITSIYGSVEPGIGDYIDGLGTDPEANTKGVGDFLYQQVTTVGDYDIFVEGTSIKLLSNAVGMSSELSWEMVLSQYPGTFTAGLSKIYLIQEDGSEVVGLLSYNPLDPSTMTAAWDTDTYHSNNYIDENGFIQDIDANYDSNTGLGTFDAIIDPTTFNPKRPNNQTTDQTITTGLRYLLVDNLGGGVRETFVTTNRVKRFSTGLDFDSVYDCELIVDGETVSQNAPTNNNGIYVINAVNYIDPGSIVSYVIHLNEDGPDAWKNIDNSDTVAYTNDIITWTGSEWRVIFSAHYRSDVIIYQTNYYTGTQYKWNGIEWKKSFEGEYNRAKWRITL